MAKAKKAKIDEQKGAPDDNTNSSEAVVKHQKLALSIDMEHRRIYGYTELQIVVPENGIVGLHADNLVIEKVTVDGEAAEFEVFPHYQHLDPKNRWCVVSSATSAADASGSVYLSALELELLPNLLIMCSKPDNKQQEHLEIENGDQSCAAIRSPLVQNVRNVRIEYWVEKAETGIHFNNDVLHTDNQLRRARCWFPCMDDSLQCCCYDLEFTVANNLVAVSSGTLTHQVLTKDEPPRKTYVYRLDVPVAPQWISLVVAPFEIISDRHGGLLSHFCLPANSSKLRNTVAFFHNAFSYYVDYLSTSTFPFGSYKHVFVAPEMTVSSCSVGASISIFSSHMLFDEKIIDQTIGTRTKLAYALARQWFGVYITPEAPNDEWLLDGLAWFLTDSFIKRSLGNNEARFRRYKANCAVCLADDSGATALSSSTASKDLYGTQCIGFYGKIRSWKSVAVLQMLEKQMGPESFCKILQNIILRARDGTQTSRTLSTKEFRHFANKIGNLERPFLKEFFPRWIGSCGCPVLKMGYTYNKRKNMVELAVLRGCTYKPPDSLVGGVNAAPDSENNIGWPGMMSIRVHELDGMYDHPILSMAGERSQLLEIQCHSKLAAKRFQKTKKGSKAEGSDDNNDATATTDVRLNSDSPLLWLRADPEMEYLGEVHFNQPAQNWINQLEKDKDVIAQAQAIAVLEALPQLSFSAVNALNNFLCDSKAFWRIRVQAAYALATTTSEETDWAGLLHLINFYKSKRFDLNIGLPRPNDFHDIQEYFVLEAIPHAIALVRSSDNKSPTEAVEFILQLLKYNDNNGNVYSDVFWLAALVRSVGEIEYGQQSIVYLPSLLKRLDRLLQFDRLMPSHNGILTVSCIQSLTQIVLKLSDFVPLDSIVNLIKPYRGSKTWQIRVDASRALLELEFQSEGIDATLTLFIRYLNDEMSLRGQTKLGVCMLRLSQMGSGLEGGNNVKSDTLVALLRLLESPIAFNNITLRHYIFCILQVLAGRPPTLFGVPRDETLRMGHIKTCNELKNIFAALINHSKHPPPPEVHLSPFAPPDHHDDATHDMLITSEGEVGAPGPADHDNEFTTNNTAAVITTHEDESLIPTPQRTADSLPLVIGDDLIVEGHDGLIINAEEAFRKEEKESEQPLFHDGLHVTKEADIISNSNEIVVPKKPSKLKIRVIKPAAAQASNENTTRILTTTVAAATEYGTGHSNKIKNYADHGASSSTINRNLEEETAHSSHDIGSRLTASIGSAKPVIDDDELLRCTADSSSKVSLQTHTPSVAAEPQTSGRTYPVDISNKQQDDNKGGSGKEKKKDKDRKRKKHDHSDDVEKKRQKKEKKRKKKELAKLVANKSADKVPVVDLEAGPSSPKPEPRRDTTASSAEELSGKTINLGVQPVPAASSQPNVALPPSNNVALPPSNPSHKIKIRLKKRTPGQP